MKKIGLVTVTYVNNFGSHLQSFALQYIVSKLGYDTEIITPEGVNSDIARRRFRYLLSRWYDFGELKGYIGVAYKRIMRKLDKKYGMIHSQRATMFKNFSNGVYSYSPIATSWEELSALCAERYSTVLIGSDQNWRPANIAGGYYTLEYVPNYINKVAYSTSFGISRVIPAQRKKAKAFLSRINHLSVREDTGQKIIKDLLEKDAPVVCDPTILLEKEEWEHFIEEKKQVSLDKEMSEPYILCYFLGDSRVNREFALDLKRKTGFRILSILYGEERYYKEVDNNYDIGLYAIGPLDFVSLIRGAQYVCTDSFHGCAFSLIFEKQFYAFYKSEQGSKMSVNSRLDSMLGWAGVNNRIIKSSSDINDRMLEPIDYHEVNKRIEEKKSMSILYLKESLK